VKTAYIAGPYTADTDEQIADNIRQARAVLAELIRAGFAVFCPHTNYAWLEGEATHDFFMRACFEHLECVDAVVMLPGWQSSPGACQEYGYARGMETPVFHWPADRAKIQAALKAKSDDDAA